MRATGINEEMKIAAVNALAGLTKQDVPEVVNKAYKVENLHFGRDYIIPKPLDPRLIFHVAPAVAKAAMDSGIAGTSIEDWEAYKESLKERMGIENRLIHEVRLKAQQNPKRLVFSEAANFKMLKAIQTIIQEKIANPVLLGDKPQIEQMIAEYHLELDQVEIIDQTDPGMASVREKYAQKLYKTRQRKGMTYEETMQQMFLPNHFGMMMVSEGDADAFLSGFSSKYADVIRPALCVQRKQ